MRPYLRPSTPPDLDDSPLYLLAVLFSARQSKDKHLENATRRQLEDGGVQITFGDELPAPKARNPKGANRG